MDRRSFFKYASFSGAMTAFLGGLHPALAATWQKIGTTSGTSGTWQKITGSNSGATIGMSALAVGLYHSLALRSDGLVFGCGENLKGELGNNSVANKSTYVQALGVSNTVAIAAGKWHSLALRSDGLIFSCGYNKANSSTGYGQLGDGSTVNKSTFVQAVGISNVQAY